MRFSLPSLVFLSVSVKVSVAFQIASRPNRQPTSLYSSSSPAATKKKTLGLLTFDLDDTLYPIDIVLREADAAFARAMQGFGYKNIKPDDINNRCKEIRIEMAKTDPKDAAALTHTELRKIAIRKEMEKITLDRKLQSCADDWATPVEDLSPVVVQHAKKWATGAVSPTIVQAVLNQWEMERHHAAERHLWPDILVALERIKEEHPGVIIGAVTDGKANPLFMTFTLANYFDFCMSWEDDQAARRKFFTELGSVEGNAELQWIYDAALEKYQELASAAAALKKDSSGDPNKVWIHVGDDLAYDVGGASQSGAETILVELDDKYGQTARHRFDKEEKMAEAQPAWSMSTQRELEARKKMNDLATEKVGRTIHFLTRLPEAINEVLENEE